jgi:hypothetical protein
MIDEFAKEYLHDDLRWIHEAVLWKLDGLSEYDIRRPLTPTGTNLLGLIKGHRYYDWAWAVIDPGRPGHRHLLIRRNRRTGELAFYRCGNEAHEPAREMA